MDETDENKILDIKLKNSKKVLNPKKQNNTQFIHINKENEINSEVYLQKGKIKNSLIEKSSNNSNIINIKNSEGAIFKFTDSLGSNQEKEEKNKKIKNTFNLIEIIITQFFKCFMCDYMKIKNNINENANRIINKKLDIIIYVRNMLLFDIINRTILDNDKKNIINILCRPIISLNKSQKNEFDDFYKNYKENDFDNFFNNITELIKKPLKKKKENNLIYISKEYLKEFI